eukprot:5018793-Ditylum_brightwellii.AAC.1
MLKGYWKEQEKKDYHVVCAVTNEETREELEYCQLIKKEKYANTWKRLFANKLGRLAQGVAKREKGTNTIFFIPYEEVPEERRKDVTYRRIVCDYRPQKKEKVRTRLTVGGNLINYPDDVSTSTTDTTTAKLHINSTISTIGA